MRLIDNEKIKLTCDCGHEIQESVRRLKNNPQLTCPRCRTVIAVKADELRSTANAIDKALKNPGFK